VDAQEGMTVDEDIHAALAEISATEGARSPMRPPKWTPWSSPQQYVSPRADKPERTPSTDRADRPEHAADSTTRSEEHELQLGVRAMEEKLARLVALGTFTEEDAQRILADAAAVVAADCSAQQPTNPGPTDKPGGKSVWWGGSLRRKSLTDLRPRLTRNRAHDIDSTALWSDTDIF
jgi:hypothetical protein